MSPRPKKYFIQTFGCQANYADSEKIASLYLSQGFLPAETIDGADIVIVNTCSVRQSAENRTYGLINNLSKKLKRPQVVLAGCVLRYGVVDLQKKLPQVDRFLRREEFEKFTAKREIKKEAFVPVMEGCNNFCTYCVVPYARGREKSREFQEVLIEIQDLAERGYTEIVLLGQNVNSYGKDLKPEKKFSQLLKEIHKFSGVHKISFLTSNPWDFTNDLINSLKLPKVDQYLHLPLQSGDDEVLKRMNRKYTSEDYLRLITKIKQEFPGIKFGTDIIVGFPGETQDQFEKTVKVCREVGFVKAYVSRYSPRPGTVAAKFKDDVPVAEKKRRWKILDNLINQKHKKIEK